MIEMTAVDARRATGAVHPRRARIVRATNPIANTDDRRAGADHEPLAAEAVVGG
jgi:hypothetical protein